jgi:hypothetical protein
MDTLRFHGFARTIATRLTRRMGLGLLAGASISAFGLAETADAKKNKKVTLCFNRQTVKKPKKKAKTLLKKGASKGACSCGSGGPCFAFVTAATFTGSALQGLAGADTACQSAASAAGLPGTYMAWLSANGSTPTTRFTNKSNAGPYVRVLAPVNGGGPGVGPLVADSFAEMLACAGGICQASPISDTERGQSAPGIPVWTGTKADGSGASDTCLGWTSNAVFGLVGNQRQADQKWTDDGTNACNEARPIYCFQQAS